MIRQLFFLMIIGVVLTSSVNGQSNRSSLANIKETEVSGSQNQTIEKVAENIVSSSTKVFTYKVKNEAISTTQDNQQSSLSAQQNRIVNYFLSLQGVERASFDKATNTYTVLTNVSTKIPSTLTFN